MFSLQKIIDPLSGFKKKGNKLSAYKQVIRNKTCFSFEHEQSGIRFCVRK